MKFIGRGWQYSVYDKGNNRVLKRYNTRFQAYVIMIRDNFPYVSYPLWKFSEYYNECRQKALYSIRKISESSIDMSLFGNPKILNDLDYEQDKVTPLGSYFEGLSRDEGNKKIDEFIRFNKLLLANGLIDKSFLIGKNYGVNQKGEIILIDIGELYFDKEKIKTQIELKPWDIYYVTSTIPAQFRAYFVKEMNRNFDGAVLQF